MNIYLAAKILALKATIENDSEHEMRKIMRWYSEKFHTPLFTVEDLPTEHVLQAYYEHTFESMDREELKQNVIQVLETPEEKKKRIFEEENAVDPEQAADDEFLKMVAEEEALKAKGKPTGVTPQMPEIATPAKISWSPKEEPETELPAALHVLPTAAELFSMNDNEDSIKGMANDWSLLTPSKKK